jgi:hypothetical protein
MSKAESKPDPSVNIIVLGDVTVDTLHFRIPDSSSPEHEQRQSPRYFLSLRYGGSIVIAEMLEDALKKARPTINLVSYSYRNIAQDSVFINANRQHEKYYFFQNRFTRLENYPKDEKNKNCVYRVADKIDTDRPKDLKKNAKKELEKVFALITQSRSQLEGYSAKKCVIVLNDKALEFRELDFSWLDEFKGKPNIQIVLAMENWFEKGGSTTDGRDSRKNLWNKVVANFSDKTIVIVSAATLRANGLPMRYLCPIEQTADELANHMTHPFFSELMRCRHLIVPLGTHGVLHLDSNNKTFNATFYFLPFVKNNIDRLRLMRKSEQFGTMSGDRSILIASLSRELAHQLSINTDISSEPEEADKKISAGIETGLFLTLLRWNDHLINGFQGPTWKDGTLQPPLLSPFSNVFKDKGTVTDNGTVTDDGKEEDKIMLASLQVKLDKRPQSSRVSGIIKRCGSREKFEDLLVRIVRLGLDGADRWLREPQSGCPDAKNKDVKEAVKNQGAFITCIPYGAFGKLVTIDSQEFANYFDIYMLMVKYMEDKTWMTPLCLAVFGPPGTGKNFTIKEIMKTAQKTEAENPLVFNLSQFESLNDLTTAFHLVQHRALAKKEVPLIIFDEFDTNFEHEELGWLKYFLEPMQDC